MRVITYYLSNVTVLYSVSALLYIEQHLFKLFKVSSGSWCQRLVKNKHATSEIWFPLAAWCYYRAIRLNLYEKNPEGINTPTENVMFALFWQTQTSQFIQRLYSSVCYSHDSFRFDRNDRLFDTTKIPLKHYFTPKREQFHHLGAINTWYWFVFMIVESFCVDWSHCKNIYSGLKALDSQWTSRLHICYMHAHGQTLIKASWQLYSILEGTPTYRLRAHLEQEIYPTDLHPPFLLFHER